MRVLHLFANRKWTGPAEPALNLCVALRAIGVEADFACGPGPDLAINMIVATARDRGIEPILGLILEKNNHPFANWIDRRRLSRLLREGQYRIVHCHLDNDHRIAIGPCRKAGIPIVRSSYHGDGLRNPKRHAPFLAATRFLIEPSQLALDHDATQYRFPRERMRVVPGAIDTERFDPAREVPDGRRRLGIPPGAFVVGIVARMQTHRHYEDLWRAAQRLIAAHPDVHVLVVGRGTNQEQVGMGPVREGGLESHVHFSGYVGGDDYVGMLKAFDVNVFLVPGSDGTCRAVREAMGMARPAVVARRGMLPEIVEDGVSGLVFDGLADSLVKVIDGLVTDRARTRAMGEAAGEKARRDYALDVQARAVRAIYLEILGGEQGQSNTRLSPQPSRSG